MMVVAEIVDMFETIDSSITERRSRTSGSTKRTVTKPASRLSVGTKSANSTRSPSPSSTVETASTSSSPTTPIFAASCPRLSTMSSFISTSPRSVYSSRSPVVPLSLSLSLGDSLHCQQSGSRAPLNPRSFCTRSNISLTSALSAGDDLDGSENLGFDLFEPRPGRSWSDRHVMLRPTMVFDGIFEVMKSM